MVKYLQPALYMVIILVLMLASVHVTSHDNTLINKLVYNNNGLGVYSFEYATSDGTYRREEGGSSPGTYSLVVRGEFGYVDSRGKLYTVRYIADANGYRPLAEEDTRYNDRNIV